MLNTDVSIRDFDGQAVVAVRGELNLADTPSVASHLIAAVTAYGPSVIVDLAGLESIGYSGLSVLLRVWKWTRQSGGDLPLAAPQPPVRRLLQATGLIDVFSVYPSVEEAASSARRAQTRLPTVPQQPHSVRVTGRAADGRYAARPGTRWSGCCPSAECAGRGTSRVRPALSGARREGPPRPDR